MSDSTTSSSPANGTPSTTVTFTPTVGTPVSTLEQEDPAYSPSDPYFDFDGDFADFVNHDTVCTSLSLVACVVVPLFPSRV
jgi:hypothetical protein